MKIGESMTVRGEPTDVAFYTFVLMTLLRRLNDKEAAEAAKKEMEAMDMLKNMTFEELIKREREGTE